MSEPARLRAVPDFPARDVDSANAAVTPAPTHLPVSGGWKENDQVGGRRFVAVGDLELENGQVLSGAKLAYECWGRPNAARDNAVLILHALTGDTHVCGPVGPGHSSSGWWQGIVGPGLPIDTEKFWVIVPNVLGGCQGSTGPSSSHPADGKPWGSRFPSLTTRDMVQAEARLADYLGIRQWHTIVGPSAGGHRALEWAITYPQRLRNLVLVATGAQTTAEQAAWAHAQLEAIELDPHWNGGDYYEQAEGPWRGLGLARKIAHTTYRSDDELHYRFGNQPQGEEDPLHGGRLAVQSYLDHHGAKLALRFDAGSYRTLTRAMLTHDVGRGRGGIEKALGSITARTLVVSVDSDRLFRPRQAIELLNLIPRAQSALVRTPYGHDGFLIESAQVAAILKHFLGS